MKPNGHSWFGTAVNVMDGEQYSARMSLQGPTSLKVEGCVVGGHDLRRSGLVAGQVTPKSAHFLPIAGP